MFFRDSLPPGGALLTVLIGMFFQGGFACRGAHPHVPRGRLTCRLHSWRSSACSPRAAPPLGGTLVALIGALFQGGFACWLRSWGARRHVPPDAFTGRLRSWRSSACSSRTPPPLVARCSWCVSACSSGAASPAGSAFSVPAPCTRRRPPRTRSTMASGRCPRSLRRCV